MVNENQSKTEVKKSGKQVGITDIAYEALNQIVAKRAASGIPATMGGVVCELIIKENEK